MEKKTIAIICGGDSAEHDVSMRSAQGIESFLDKERYTVYKVEIHARHWEAILSDGARSIVDRNDFSFKDGDKTIHPDYAYITIHGAPGENGILQGQATCRRQRQAVYQYHRPRRCALFPWI